MSTLYDAVVIGGGPAGATAALLLARAGWSVVLLERKTFPRRKVCGEYVSATSLPLLDQLGLGDVFRNLAGPPVCRVGVFAGEAVVQSDLPGPRDATFGWGRALSRETLDTWLVEQAHAAGAEIRQPWSVSDLSAEGPIYACAVQSEATGALGTVRAPVVIAAHGSWESGRLPTQLARQPARPSDLLAFKAHFSGSDLPQGLMPLLAFPDGYGGMVHCDGGRMSLSFCIRHDRLTRAAACTPGAAGETVLAHILNSCAGLRQALTGARREGAWLASGPMRPGIRRAARRGVFAVGNAAGESHPAIADGIGMAIQSAFLLAGQLTASGSQSSPTTLASVGRAYEAAWHRQFALRVRFSAVIAHWAMRPSATRGTLPLLRSAGLLT